MAPSPRLDPQRDPPMPVSAALQVLVECRAASQVVVTNQASARLWPKLSDHRLDFHYNPSTMGGAIPLALGLALAQPDREVVVVTGEGSLLMSLGSLVTVVASGASNLTVVVLDNQMYEVTGGQATPATGVAVDFETIARGTGFTAVRPFSDLSAWRAEGPGALAARGPRLIVLRVGPTDPAILKSPAPPMEPRLARFQDALNE